MAVADALGAPFEFKRREEIQGEIEMRGGGNFAPGEWTDDTEMTLMLAESIGEGLDWEKLAARYIAWAASDPKDIGITTRAALYRAKDFKDATKRAHDFHKKTGRSAGNGTIMRSSPLAFLPVKDSDLKAVIEIEAGITHAAREAAEASYVQAIIIRKLLRGEPAEIDTDGLTEKTRKAIENSSDKEKVAAMIKEGGSAWSSVAAGIWSLSFQTFEEGLREVIRLGYDTDTNAASAGAMIGARDGFEAIPSRWREKIIKRNRLDKAIKGLYNV